MNHSFNVEVAIHYGVPCALVLGHIEFLVDKARKEGANKHNGKYWACKSVKRFAELYPYLSEKQIRRAVDTLRREELVITGHFPAGDHPSTLWYTLTKKAKSLLETDTNLPQGANQIAQEGNSDCPIGQNRLPQGANQIAQEGIPSTYVLSNVLDSCNKEEEKEADPLTAGDGWTEFVREYEGNIGLLPTSMIEREDMIMFFEEFGLEALREFIHYTARKHPDKPHVYFSKLCRNWLGKGITTAQQAQAAFKDYERRKKGGANGGEHQLSHVESPQRVAGETIV
jgi:hypothetical protein